MAKPVLLPLAFDGMWQDNPRNNLPKGKAWNIIDAIPEVLGSPWEERGGWAYASPDLTAVDSGATFIKALLNVPFEAGEQLVAIDDNGKLVKIVSGTNTLIGSSIIPVQNPFMHQQLVVIPSPDGSTGIETYNGSAVSSVSSGPEGKYGTVFVNYSWIGGDSTNPFRGYASNVGDPTTWVLTGANASYIDVSFPIRAMAALPNVMLWFGDEITARIRGTTPPPNTDMQVDDPIFNWGTIDARSVAVNGSLCCFANAVGVFLSNGTAFPEDLTMSCGLSTYWRNLTAARTSSWTFAGGWFGNVYVICVMNGATFVDCLAFDVVKRSAYRFSNIETQAFAPAGSAGQELYAGSRATPRVMQLSSMWTPGSSYKNDGDGSAVLGVYESPFYTMSAVGMQRWKDLYLEYDLRDAGADDPTFSLSYCLSPESGAAYTSIATDIAATTAKDEVRRHIHSRARGMGFKVTRANAASYARVYSLGANVTALEGSRLS